jgi:ubiquinone/menaquinone biosynthesis C-methylase UbiE
MEDKPVSRSHFNTNSWNRTRYTLWAPFYNLLVRGFHNRRQRALELLNLQPGEKVLLVGAGTGLDLDVVLPQAAITAIDLTPAMLKKLQQRAVRLGLQVDARVMDAQKMDFADGAFDAVVLHLILAVIPDPIRCAREVARVLRPEGRVVIFDKFLPDGAQVPLSFKILGPIAGFFGTEITRQLNPILSAAKLHVTHEEPAGFNGLFKIALASKS